MTKKVLDIDDRVHYHSQHNNLLSRKVMYTKIHVCFKCNVEWEDSWDDDCGLCNDKCPECNTEIEPCAWEDGGEFYESEYYKNFLEMVHEEKSP